MNIMVFKTKGDHTAFHHGANIYLENDVWCAYPSIKLVCPICGKTKAKTSDICLECYKNAKVAHIPSKEELYGLIASDMSMESIASQYHVSSAAIRKWCKKYEIEYHRNKRPFIA